MRFLLCVLSSLMTLSGCSRRAVSVDLKEFASGTAGVSLNLGPSQVAFYLSPQKEMYNCPILSDPITVKLNGNSDIISSSAGALEPDEGNGTCGNPYFVFYLDSLSTSPGAPDGEFVIEQPGASYEIRLSVSNLAVERKPIRLTSPTTFKPGSEIRYDWQPGTDLVRSGGGVVDGQNYDRQWFDARVESQQLVVNLPTAPWPAGAKYFFSGNAVAPIIKCEGVQTCVFSNIQRSESLELPTL